MGLLDSRAVALLLLAGAVSGGSAVAGMDLSAGATVGIEHNTNVFDLSGREDAALSGSSDKRSDTANRLTAMVGAKTDDQGPLQADLRAQYSKIDSFHFDSQDRSEYTFTGNLDWKPGTLFDVSLRGSRTRQPLSLADVGGSQATLQTSSEVQGTLRVRPVPSWQIGLTPGWRETRTPLPGAQDFKLRENSGTVALDFLGAGRVVPGISASRAKGVNSAIANPTRYEIESVQGTLNYKATGFSNFSLAAGHTRRQTRLIFPSSDPLALANDRDDSGFTTTIAYQRQLSVKTNLNIAVFREFQQFDVGVNPTVDTGFRGGVSWAPTPKLVFALNTEHRWSTIEGLRVGGSVGQRKDLLRSFGIDAGYLASQRFSLRTYANRRLRNSDRSYNDQFNGWLGGVELTFKVD